MSVLGHILVPSGRGTEAVELLEQGLRRTDAVGMTAATVPTAPRTSPRPTCWSAVLRMQRRARPKAVESGARARRDAASRRGRCVCRRRSRCAAQPPDVAAAEERYREAKALAGALEMRPLVAHCHLGLGRLSIRTGDREEARRHLAVATSMYREMDMRFWLEQAEGEVKDLTQ